ncbi:MAG: type II toxin-antitoxin system RelE/ParE family toxin [Rhodospirillales bacterium]|nr:type II toxin-antitoxin system RelE/ParE family toxin [Rhodospirillales bacterium]
MKVRLARRARADLAEIWQYSDATWGADRADDYLDALTDRILWLAGNRGLWRARDDIAPGLYSHLQGSHVIVFREDAGELQIVRILHSRMDIKRHL